MLNRYIYLGLLAVGFTACKVPKPVADTPLTFKTTMPQQYPGSGQSDTSKQLPVWQQFFGGTQLRQLIDSALTNNLELKSSQQQVAIVGALERMARVNNRPVVDAVFNAQADRFAFYTMNGIGNFDLNKSDNISADQRLPEVLPDLLIGVRSQWEIDLWGRLKAQRQAAKLRLLAARDGLQWLKTQLAAEVAYHYFEYLGLTYEQEVVQRNLALQTQALEVVRAQKEGGRATELAVRQFAAQVARTQAIGFDVQRQQQQSLNRLSALLGRYPMELTCEQELMAFPIPETVTIGTPAGLLQNRPDIRAAQQEWLAATADLKTARAQFFPQLVITPTLGFQGFKPGKLFQGQSVAAGLIGNLAAPLTGRRRVRESYAIAQAQREQQALQAEMKLVTAFNEVHALLRSHALMNSQMEAKRREYQELRAAISNAQELYKQGYANYLEVIAAQQGLLDAEIAVTLLRKNQLQNMVHLYRALGGGWD